MAGLGVDLHPYYQRGVTALPGVEYGWLKLADGAQAYTFRDPTGRVWTPKAHADLFKALGIPFGGYVYAQPGDGALEARVLWSLCQQYGATGVTPACDIESSPNIHTWSTQEAIDHGRAFCAQMRSLGVRPAIYMSDSLAGATNPDAWPEDPVLWIARYGAVPQHTRYDVHQYADNGTLPGSAGEVDWNQQYTTAHLLTDGGTLVATPDEIKAIAQATVDEWMSRQVEVADSNPKRYLPASGFLTWTNGDTAAIRAAVTQLAAKADGASATDIAAALLPALTSAITAELAHVDTISDADAQQIAKAVTDRAAALLHPTA